MSSALAAPLVAHNAGFDIAFIKAELKRAAKPPIE
jgi:DNA polymerase III epsilon subunit-like protein